MKKLALIFALSALFLGCGVQRPYAPAISLLSGSNAALPFSDQGGLRVQTGSAYNVKLDWDITNTGGQGIKILIADGADYYCDSPIATRTFYIPSSATIANSSIASLGYMFRETPTLFQYGKSYAICLCAVMYDSISGPSLPVFLDIVAY